MINFDYRNIRLIKPQQTKDNTEDIKYQSIGSFLKNTESQDQNQTHNITIKNCEELALFATEEGQNYLCFEIVSREEMEAYFKKIVMSFLTTQTQFTPQELQSPEDRDRMAMLIVKLHGSLNFSIQTLHLAVAIADRFLSVKNIKQFQYQIVGITSLWMAAKMQQSKIPKFGDWLRLGNGCLAQELLEFQFQILKILDYNLNIPTSLSFFHFILTQNQIQQRVFFLCHYLLQLSLTQSKYLNYRYSLITVSAYYLSLSICDKQDWSSKYFCPLMHVNEQQLQKCTQQLLNSLILASSKSNNTVYQKFRSDCFFKVSQITFVQMKQRSISGKSTHSTLSYRSN